MGDWSLVAYSYEYIVVETQQDSSADFALDSTSDYPQMAAWDQVIGLGLSGGKLIAETGYSIAKTPARARETWDKYHEEEVRAEQKIREIQRCVDRQDEHTRNVAAIAWSGGRVEKALEDAEKKVQQRPAGIRQGFTFHRGQAEKHAVNLSRERKRADDVLHTYDRERYDPPPRYESKQSYGGRGC
jgi:hypothetical protein